MFSIGVCSGRLSAASNGIFEHSLSANGPIGGLSATVNLMGTKVTLFSTVAAPSGALTNGVSGGVVSFSCGDGGKTSGVAKVLPSTSVGDND